MLFVGDLRRNKNAKMPNLLVNHVDNAFATDTNFSHVGIRFCNPVQCLLGWRDIVAMTSKDNNRRLNILQINRASRLNTGFVFDDTVANEQLFHDPSNLGFIHQKKASPPPFEFKKCFFSSVSIPKQIGVLFKKCPARVQELKVLNQMGTIKLSAANVREQHGNPRAPEHPGVVSHWILANLARPRRYRRTIDHNRTCHIRVVGGQ